MIKIVATSNAPKALGPYNQAVINPKSGLVFTAGQIAIDPKTGELKGSDAREQTEQVMQNLQAILLAAGSDMNKVLRATIFLKSLKDFGVINETYSRYFKADFPARATVEVSGLPKDALLEIELIAYI